LQVDVVALPSPVRWNLKHGLILVALLAVGFGVFGIVGSVLLGLMFSPVLLAPRGRRLSRLFWLGASYPLFVVLGLYVTWIDGWIALCHPPRFWIDDPKDIALDEGIERLVALIWLTVPFVWGTALSFSLHWIEDSSKTKLHCLARYYPLFVVLLTAFLCFVLLLLDPLRVLQWYVD
jgi:hypothetical protein